MSHPKTLLLHEAPHGGDPDSLAAELKEQTADLGLVRAQNYDDALQHIKTADIVITRKLTNELLGQAENLDWIQALNAGVDSYDLDRIGDMNITLTNASGVHANPIAEQVLGYMLMFERNLNQGLEQQRRREWNHYGGGELRRQTLGVLGVGKIGSRIAQLGSALDMRVLGTKRDTNEIPDSVDEIFPPQETHTVLGRCDYVVVACPLNESTRGSIGLPEFASMKHDSVVINIGRGAVVDQDDLITAIQKSKIRGAALDVTDPEPLPEDSPLWELSNVIITPHMAGSTPHYWERCAEIFSTNYARYLEQNYEEFINRVL
ncbi:D-2-hydroxyacid dehydrogenase [Halobacterium noricense]|uniref:D-2-hydroxyacid dehydrogenase n=1 Tax=Halobacterium noricense TaxID=223182 RepID=UPI001E3615EF|nr:D-2-hydroxyacid dehydrogenase [Halobacterium noricense]UHH23912.1 D-2-hydroxyacid dehydrogenase [Halobacterium noricense]